MSESQLVAAIIKRLWFERSWLTMDRANSGARTFTDSSGRKGFYRGHSAGWADLIGYCKPSGQFVALEVKLPGKKQQPSQRVFEDDVLAKGGVYRVVTSLDDVEQFIKEYKI